MDKKSKAVDGFIVILDKLEHNLNVNCKNAYRKMTTFIFMAYNKHKAVPTR